MITSLVHRISKKTVLVPFGLWAIGSLIVLVAAARIVSGDKRLWAVLLAFGISVIFFSVLVLVEFRISVMVERSRSAVQSAIRKVDRRVDSAITVRDQQEQTEALETALSSATSGRLEGGGRLGLTPQQELTAYTPLLIPETTGERNRSKSVGRSGATMSDDIDTDTKLALLLSSAYQDAVPLIELIGSDTDAVRLSTHGDVRRVHPGMQEIALRSSANYFVISTRAFRSGSWKGCTDSSRYSLFSQVREAMTRARAAGTVTVFVEVEGVAPSHYTNSLRSACDAVFSPTRREARINGELHTRLTECFESLIGEVQEA